MNVIPKMEGDWKSLESSSVEQDNVKWYPTAEYAARVVLYNKRVEEEKDRIEQIKIFVFWIKERQKEIPRSQWSDDYRIKDLKSRIVAFANPRFYYKLQKSASEIWRIHEQFSCISEKTYPIIFIRNDDGLWSGLLYDDEKIKFETVVEAEQPALTNTVNISSREEVRLH